MALKYAIVGAGALGGYYGGRLARHGGDVHFLYHTEYEYVKQHGLKVKSVKGDFELTNMNVYNNTADMPQCDVVLVMLKTTQNGKLKDMLKPLLKPETVVILVQNGLGYEQLLAKDFPDTCIGGGLAFICASRVGKGEILHADYGELTIGFYNEVKSEIAEQIKTDFENAGVRCTMGNDLNFLRWRKLVWNIPYNGLTVVLHTTTDKIMQNPASRQLVTDMMNEVIEGARACGAMVKPDFVQRMLDNTDKMEPYAPSMRLDYDNHRTMEIEAIYSNPVQLAKEAGYYMRKVEMLEQQLRFIQANEIDK